MATASQLGGPIAAIRSRTTSRARGAFSKNSFSRNQVGARPKNPVNYTNRITSLKATIPGEVCAMSSGMSNSYRPATIIPPTMERAYPAAIKASFFAVLMRLPRPPAKLSLSTALIKIISQSNTTYCKIGVPAQRAARFITSWA